MYGEEKNGQKTPQDNIIKHALNNTAIPDDPSKKFPVAIKPVRFILLKKLTNAIRTQHLAPDRVSLKKTTISFGFEVLNWLNTGYIQIYFDDSNQFIAFKPSTADEQNAFRIYGSKKERRKPHRINASKIIRKKYEDKNIKFGDYPAHWSVNWNMVIVKYDINDDSNSGLTPNIPPLF